MIRRVAPFVLSLVLCLASVGMAMMHAMGGTSRQMVLCTGYDLVEVTIDRNGNRVPTPHHCPDCMASVVLGLPPVAVDIGPQTALPPPAPMGGGSAAPRLNRLPPKAQGPPVRV